MGIESLFQAGQSVFGAVGKYMAPLNLVGAVKNLPENIQAGDEAQVVSNAGGITTGTIGTTTITSGIATFTANLLTKMGIVEDSTQGMALLEGAKKLTIPVFALTAVASDALTVNKNEHDNEAYDKLNNDGDNEAAKQVQAGVLPIHPKQKTPESILHNYNALSQLDGQLHGELSKLLAKGDIKGVERLVDAYSKPDRYAADAKLRDDTASALQGIGKTGFDAPSSGLAKIVDFFAGTNTEQADLNIVDQANNDIRTDMAAENAKLELQKFKTPDGKEHNGFIADYNAAVAADHAQITPANTPATVTPAKQQTRNS